MPQPCTICTHPARFDIEVAILGGEPNRAVARQWGLSKDAVARHKADHLPARLLEARDAEEVAEADDLLGQLRDLQADARRIGNKAEAAQDYRAALAGVRELVRIVELLARLTERLDDGSTTVNIQIDARTQSVILDALLDYPQARIAVAEALIEVEDYEE